MKHGVLGFALTLGLLPVSVAQERPAPAPTYTIDDEAEVIRHLEERLNEILMIDEGGRILMRQEFRELLPENVPVERVQAMLGALVELGQDGKVHFRNTDTIRPYLPMLRGFLDDGMMERLKALRELPPEQRREAVRKMMEEQGMGGVRPSPRPEARPQARPEARPAPQPQPEREARRPERGSALEERLSRLEDRLERMERLLERGSGRSAERGESRERRGPGLGDLARRAEVWRRGVETLVKLLEPADFDRLRRLVGRMREKMSAEDLRDRGQLLQKLQESMDPQDMGRMMEVFSSFIATPEGREMVAELERTVQRLEALVNSPQGERLGKLLERLQGGDRLRDGLERLIQPRREREQEEPSHRERARRHEGERKGEQETRRPPGSRLY